MRKLLLFTAKHGGSGWGVTNVSCQLEFRLFVSCQLNFRQFVSCQLKFWPFVN